MLKRKIDDEFESFYARNGKEAILVDGARQVGKTFSIREYGRRHFKHVVEINFIKQKEAVDLFKGVLDESTLFLKISALTDEPLVKGETLVFFDEVQECPEIVTHIKFLVEEGSYRYVLSGSLLGVELKNIRSAPVGYLRELTMYPLDFEEFLQAHGFKRELFDHVRIRIEQAKPVDPAVHEKLMALFRTYLVVGGMPQAVDMYFATQSISEVVKVQRAILVEYKKDAAKYDKEHRLQIGKTLELIPEELNRKYKRFVVADLEKGQRYERVEDSFIWLEEAGIALSVRAVSDPRVPLRLSRNFGFFKLFMNDVGLLASLYMDNVQYRILSQETDVNFGAVYENFVAQELTAHGYVPYYFRTDNGACEVDFLIERDGCVLPVEVKSGKNYKTHASLNNLLATHEYGLAEAVTLSNANVSRSADGKIRYLPVYALMFFNRLSTPDKIELPAVPTRADIVFREGAS